MKNRTWICLLCGLGSWGLFVLSMLTMDLSTRWIAYGLAALWVASSLGGVVSSLVFRYRLGIRKSGAVGWGMTVSVLMVAVQIFVLLLSFLQQRSQWETSTVGAVSGGVAFATVVILMILYRFLGRKGQEHIESASHAKSDSE